MLEAGGQEYNARVDAESSDDDDSAGEEYICDEELFEELETMAFRDQYRGRSRWQSDSEVEQYSSDSDSVGPVSPSKKRRRAA